MITQQAEFQRRDTCRGFVQQDKTLMIFKCISIKLVRSDQELVGLLHLLWYYMLVRGPCEAK